MAGLLWFFPGATPGVTWRKLLADAGLSELQVEGDSEPSLASAACEGPEGLRGLLAFYQDREQADVRPMLYRAEGQAWKPASRRGDLARGRYWVGMFKDAKPGPAELARDKQPLGLEVNLGSASWRIPTARDLSQTLGLDDDGRLSRQFDDERHQRYHDTAWDLVAKIRATAAGGVLRYSEEEHFRFAAEALSLGYRVNVDALTLLGAIKSDNVWGAAWAAAGCPWLEDPQKKAELEPGIGAGVSG